MQQADEQVVDGNIQADRCHDVVALAALDDGAGLKQNADRRKQNETGADSQLQAADLEEEACQCGAQKHKEDGSDETAQEAHVLAADQHVGRQTTKDQGLQLLENFAAWDGRW